MVPKEAEKAVMEWNHVNDRIVHFRFFSKAPKATIIHVYAPTNFAIIEEKEDFYEQLQTTVDKVPKHDILIITGDMNAKVGSRNTDCERVMGKHGVGERNDNEERLVEFCSLNYMVICGTIFPHKTIHKTTWTSPDDKTKHQIDHVLVNSKYRSSVMDTRTMRGADINSDHYLVVAKVRVKLKANKKIVNRRRYDVRKLENPDIKTKFARTLRNSFAVVEEELQHFRNSL